MQLRTTILCQASRHGFFKRQARRYTFIRKGMLCMRAAYYDNPSKCGGRRYLYPAIHAPPSRVTLSHS